MIDRAHAGQLLSEMVEIGRTLQASAQHSRAGGGLTGTKFGVLQQLRRGDARLGTIAEHLAISAPVASRAVDALETEGLVWRRRDPEDARASLISVTDSGHAYLTEREGYVVDKFAAALADWSAADAEKAIGVLQRLNEHLGEVTAPPGQPDTRPKVATTASRSEVDR